MSLFSTAIFGPAGGGPATDPRTPVVLARVDNRLVHGQILSAWIPALNADTLLVIDDEASRNTLVRGAMEIAIPPDVQFVVSDVHGAAARLKKLPPGARAILLFRDVAEAARAIEAGLELSQLNLGNIHHLSGRVAVSQAVHLSPTEVGQLEELGARGVVTELKTLPRDTPIGLPELKRRVQAGSQA